ncbi:MAG: NHL repeat-containing protein, partial [Pigmentiphaga sp.]
MQRRHFLKASGASALLLATTSGCGGSDTEALAPLHGHTRRLASAPGGGVIEWLPEANQVRAFNAAGVQQWAHLGRGQASNSLNVPAGVVFLAGRVYIADLGNSRIVVLDERGRWQFEFGGHGATRGRFRFVKGIAAGPEGNLYCCDPGNHRVQMFDANGDWQGDLGGFGLEGFGLNGPGALAFDSAGRPHVIDRGNRRVVVFSSAGQGVRAYGG